MSDASVAIEKPRLLVVEDSATMRMALKRILREDYDVAEAADGQLGWEAVEGDATIRAVFSDLMMPNKDGFELLQAIRNAGDPRIQELPVIIITGADDDDTKRQQALEAGASDFITKPFDSLQLRARARAHVRVGENLVTAQPQPEHSTIDPSTGFPNKLYFEQHGPQQLAAAIRQGVELSFLRVNVDHFDELFRQRGRRVAEKIVQFVAKLLQNNVRAEDTVARLDLDKFGVLMYGCGHESAEQAAKRIHYRAGKTGFQLGNDRFTITISAALVTPSLGMQVTFEELRQQSETFLHSAIEAGGNQLVAETLAAPSEPEQAEPVANISLDEAVELLRVGNRQTVDQAMPLLLKAMLPLLERADAQLGLGVGFMLQQIRKVSGPRSN